MKKQYMKQFVGSLMIVTLSIVLLASAGYAQTVRIKAYPQTQEIEIYQGQGPSPKQIAITTETDDPGASFKWSLSGPGTLKGDATSAGIFYLPPDNSIYQRATVAVEVTNRQGKKASDKVSFNLTPKELPSPPKVQIGAIQVKENDIPMYPMYLVNPGAMLMIEVDISKPADRNINLSGSAILGNLNVYAQSNQIGYTAPKEPGEVDMVTLKAVDGKTNEVVEQRLLMIKVNETAQ